MQAATTRAAVTTCFITLRTAPDRQLVRCTVYKSLRFNLNREEQRGVFQVTATGLQATQRGHAGDRDQRNLETCSVVTTRLLNKPPRVCHCSGQGCRDTQNKLNQRHEAFGEYKCVPH